MEIKEGKQKMNKRKLGFLCAIMVLGIALPVYGEEVNIQQEGNVTVLEEDVEHLHEDYTFLEEQISELTESSNQEGTVSNVERKARIVSKGNIDFNNQTVYLSAQDLIFLAEEIDQLESTYKETLVDALNVIGTYFQKDGTIIYDSSLNEVNSIESKKSMALGSIKQGIIQSQSVQSISSVQAKDKDENPLYYLTEEAKENGEHLNFTTDDTGFPLYYKEAEANSLSAGTSAWVNGVLLKGNGEDNKKSWQNGYNQGYTQGVADSINKANIVYTYHEHTDKKGKCYGTLTGVKRIICGCNSYAHTDSLPGYEGISSCANCKHNHPGERCSYTSGYEPYTYIGLVCGKTEETIESATIIY